LKSKDRPPCFRLKGAEDPPKPPPRPTPRPWGCGGFGRPGASFFGPRRIFPSSPWEELRKSVPRAGKRALLRGRPIFQFSPGPSEERRPRIETRKTRSDPLGRDESLPPGGDDEGELFFSEFLRDLNRGGNNLRFTRRFPQKAGGKKSGTLVF
jgi:hypothetical protein